MGAHFDVPRAQPLVPLALGLAAAALLLAFPAPAADRGVTVRPVVHGGKALYSNSWAIVVGIDDYGKAPRLQYAANDARSVASELARRGWPAENTILLVDSAATRQAIREALERTVRKRAKGADRLLVFFAGHGVTEPLPAGGEEGWLLPVEGDPDDLPLTAISMTDLRGIFRRLPPKHTLLVVDACYGGYSLSRATGPMTYDAAYLERLTRERVVRVLTAGGKKETVAEEGGHGLLTAKFLKGISGLADTNGDGLIPANELFVWLDPLVVRDSQGSQKPVFGSLDGEGEFVFVVGEAQVTAPGESAAEGLLREAEAKEKRLAAMRREAEEKTYQDALEAEFQRLLQLERYEDAVVGPSEKAKAWEGFLTAYPVRNQHEDHARGRVRYWEEKARRAPERPAQPVGPSDMVFVPAGEFTMGSNDGGGYEKPVHKVYLGAFWIDRTEVTVGAYEECVRAGRCSAASTGGSCNSGKSDRAAHPINCVDWSQAKAYCEWAGKRLPAEAEWEKAARGTDGRTYPWGNEKASCQYAVIDEGGGRWGCGRGSTWPVGSKPSGASPYGALDMAGNVREWVADWYDEDYYRSSPSRNPKGPSGGSRRVLRGGSWYHDTPANLRAASRYGLDPALRNFHYLGFRCARDGN